MSLIVASTCIQLHVGEHAYTLNLQTLALSPPGLLARMFGPQSDYCLSATVRDAADRIFLDRDGAAFAVIATFLRTGIAHVPAGLDRYRADIELDYFFDAPPRAKTSRMLRFESSTAACGIVAELEHIQCMFLQPEYTISGSPERVGKPAIFHAGAVGAFLRTVLVCEYDGKNIVSARIYCRVIPGSATAPNSTTRNFNVTEAVMVLLDIIYSRDASDARDEYGTCLADLLGATRLEFLPHTGQSMPTDEWTLPRAGDASVHSIGMPHLVVEFRDEKTRFLRSIRVVDRRASTDEGGH